MTQPPGPPPQGGFGPTPPNGPPPGGGQWQPPAGPPQQPSYGYPQAPDQPTVVPGQPGPYGQPYGEQPYGAPGGYPPPPPGGPGGGSGGKIAMIIAGAVALLALLAGGVYLAVGDDDGKEPIAGPSTSAAPTAGTDAGGTTGGSTQPTDDPADDPTSDPFDSSGGSSSGGGGDAPAGDDFRGQWTADGKVLTIADKFQYGEHAGKFNLNWIDIGGGKGICIGWGEMQGHDLRLTVTCDGKDVSATAHKDSSGQGVSLSWDDGATDDLGWEGPVG